MIGPTTNTQIWIAAGVTDLRRGFTGLSAPFENQPMPEQFKIQDVPKTARQVSCFASFKKDSTVLDVVRKCGIPDQHAGSGIYIFVYYMVDCSTVTGGTPDLKRLGIKHVKQKKTTVLFNNW